MPFAVAGSLAAVAAALAFDQGAFFPHSWVWGATVFLWLAALALLLRSRLAVSAAEWWWLASLGALAGWTLLSRTWSDAPAQSLLDARRDLLYLAAAGAVALCCSRVAARALPALLLGAIAAVVVAGIARYLVSSAGRLVVGQVALLAWPLGYANAMAAVAAMGMPLALAGGAHARSRGARAAAAALVAPLAGVPVLSSSRGGAVALLVAVATLLWLDPRRRVVIRLAVAAAPSAALVVATCLASDVTNFTLAGADLRRARILTAVALLVGSAGSAAASLAAPRRGRRAAIPTARAAAVVAAVACAVGIVTATLPRLGAGAQLRHLVGVERAGYWAVAWTEAGARPLRGTGAGSFGLWWALHGPAALGNALDAHNVYLEALAELGPVGFLLLVAALALPLLAARRAVAATRVGAATAAAYVAFLVDAFVEWDWELPTVTVTAVLLGGTLLVLGRRPASELSRRARAAALAVALALAAAAVAGARSSTLPGVAAGEPAATVRGRAAALFSR